MRNCYLVILMYILTLLAVPALAVADTAFRIGAGDVLEISVWKDPELSRKVVVPPDGVVSFPLINTVKAKGLTIAQLRNLISKKLAEYVPDVTVTAMIAEINSLKAYVIGKVNAPGEYPIALDTNVMQILAKAKGLTPFASKGNIMLLRRVNGKMTKISFDYGEIEKGRRLEQNIIIRAGDVVVVP